MTDLVFLRDATDRPHARPLYHYPRKDSPSLSACGRALLIEDAPCEPSEVADGLRCKFAGCRARWP